MNEGSGSLATLYALDETRTVDAGKTSPALQGTAGLSIGGVIPLWIFLPVTDSFVSRYRPVIAGKS